jgi:hypothetical protein
MAELQTGNLQGEARLAGPAGAGEREQSDAWFERQQIVCSFQLPLAAEKLNGLRNEVGARVYARRRVERPAEVLSH